MRNKEGWSRLLFIMTRKERVILVVIEILSDIMQIRKKRKNHQKSKRKNRRKTRKTKRRNWRKLQGQIEVELEGVVKVGRVGGIGGGRHYHKPLTRGGQSLSFLCLPFSSPIVSFPIPFSLVFSLVYQRGLKPYNFAFVRSFLFHYSHSSLPCLHHHFFFFIVYLLFSFPIYSVCLSRDPSPLPLSSSSLHPHSCLPLPYFTSMLFLFLFNIFFLLLLPLPLPLSSFHPSLSSLSITSGGPWTLFLGILEAVNRFTWASKGE